MDMVFIVNPVAGKGKGKKILPMIQDFMNKTGQEYEIWITKKPKEGSRLAARAREMGVKKVVAVGGDGTISEVVNGLAMSKVELGVIPAGTGNDLCRTLKVPLKVEEALELAIQGKSYPMDLGKVGKYYFMNVASIGLDAEIAQWTNKVKKWFPGTIAYIISVFKNLVTYQYRKIKISLDQGELKENILLLAIGNGKYYGGGMKITPSAKINDGIFEICMIQQLPKWKIGILFPTIFKGKHIYIKGVHLYETKQVTITEESKTTVNIDGEIVKMNSPVQFSIQSNALKVIYPNIE